MTSTRSGWTLAELLVVLGIVSVLAGIAFPCLRGVMRAATACTCRGHMREVGMAAMEYANEWDQCLPAEGNYGIDDPERSPAWFCRLPAYYETDNVIKRLNVFQCSGFSWHGPKAFTNATPKSFKMNSYLDNDGRPRHYTFGSVPDESEIVLFVDAVARETGMGQWGYAVMSAVDDSRHRGRVNVLYCDGHATATLTTPADGDWKDRLKWKSDRWVK